MDFKQTIMKKTLLIISLTILSLFAFSQTYDVYIQGIVTDEATGEPIYNQEMSVAVDTLAGGFTYYSTVFTDQQGFFVDTMSIPNNLEGFVEVSTISCGEVKSEDEYFSINTRQLFFDFDICSNPVGSDCEAFFSFFYEEEPLSVQFIDLSIGSITDWYWDFGDGDTSLEQNPIHYYSQAGTYYTTLTIDGDSCNSEYSFMVDVYNDTIFSCEAFFLYESGEEPLSIQFIDFSIGEITNYTWDFGDGNTSNEQNPEHQYSSSGWYYVNLFIEEGNICSSTYEEYLFVENDTNYCKSDFYVSLDTINNIPNTYIFTDESEGNIESWEWNFGDGDYSYEQNPVHVYNENGTYSVCLTIWTSMGSNDMCTSTTCKEISTPEYFNFGGQAFIGDYPINIEPGDDANTAIAYLYRKVDNVWEYMDEREFWEYGYYWFVDKPTGDYLILTELTENSLDFSNYAPSYYGNSLSWKNASTFYLNNDQQFSVNISLQELVESALGVGSISGEVIGGMSCDTMHNIDLNKVLVHLYNSSKELISYTYSDNEGDFEFNGLGNGIYFVSPEYPGRYTSETSISITTNEPNVSDVELVVHCSQTLGIDDYYSEYIDFIDNIYPNPVIENAFLNISVIKPTNIKLSIYNYFGQHIYSNDVSLTSEINKITLPTKSMVPGMYFVKITTNDNISFVRKFIKGSF